MHLCRTVCLSAVLGYCISVSVNESQAHAAVCQLTDFFYYNCLSLRFGHFCQIYWCVLVHYVFGECCVCCGLIGLHAKPFESM